MKTRVTRNGWILVGSVLIAGLAFNGLRAEQMTAAEDPAKQGLAVATFAGGCFWCIEAGFEKVPGVVDAVSGYTAGEEKNPKYTLC